MAPAAVSFFLLTTFYFGPIIHFFLFSFALPTFTGTAQQNQTFFYLRRVALVTPIPLLRRVPLFEFRVLPRSLQQ